MTPEGVMTLGRQAMEVTLMVSAPMLIVVLVIGLLVSIFQAATQINETTLSFIPKLVGVFAVLVIAGPWMLSVMLDYMRAIFTSIPSLAG
ncbi:MULTISPECIES: flagellar biosynthesis protein FliQ [Methylovorus]|jgi:flagellar biosynthesis protein FliQ|uniref:Flagellar biosynthetic protein FliQ n=1 Tax=Methylovorus glucosotrophus (strain SIP3-4) TaxID=582744 RepID=C6XAT3_METGS|nr:MULTISPECIES: flagellar biosynthesis protein FliQ [Methylovorus]HWU34299.1 flagellar biosynthesis protein FliQ [Methylovorus sp.]ACT50015.1 flagellar biosynthetic protein FliQ [Methylovorus glucosotrophus SIP3-4]ADQ83976.1 flagellar biosynthetic protein FliQ [Methylovorus sp. MP688]KAF0844641.1 flagellar biosynthetic protein FliQ [Methylovorus glucosotrophus]MCB4812341.1 flagellar biosynthesis protein FliQ [Methylovorus menthalis]